jgi:hypothetical protein
MTNMSYCRFQNTVGDLEDCQDALDNGALFDEDMSDEEQRAARRLVRMCGEIHREHGDAV